MRPRSVLPLVLLAASVGPSCSPQNRGVARGSADSGWTQPTTDSTEVEPPTLTSIRWAMQSDPLPLTTEAGELVVEGTGGLAVQLGQAWVVVYVLVLETCDASTSTGRRSSSPPPPHGLPDHPSAMTQSHAIPLHTDDLVQGERRSFDADEFCDVGIALFRGENNTENVPPDDTLTGVTLLLDGQIRRGVDAPWESIEYRTALAAEADLPLSASQVAAAAGSPAEATVTFHPQHLLDGVPPTEAEDRIAFQMLQNLARTATVTLTPESP